MTSRQGTGATCISQLPLHNKLSLNSVALRSNHQFSFLSLYGSGIQTGHHGSACLRCTEPGALAGAPPEHSLPGLVVDGASLGELWAARPLEGSPRSFPRLPASTVSAFPVSEVHKEQK